MSIINSGRFITFLAFLATLSVCAVAPGFAGEDEAEKAAKVNSNSAHFDKIGRAHPDWETLMDSGEVIAWIEAQPSFYQNELNRIIYRGSADEAIALLNEFKKSKYS